MNIETDKAAMRDIGFSKPAEQLFEDKDLRPGVRSHWAIGFAQAGGRYEIAQSEPEWTVVAPETVGQPKAELEAKKDDYLLGEVIWLHDSQHNIYRESPHGESKGHGQERGYRSKLDRFGNHSHLKSTTR